MRETVDDLRTVFTQFKTRFGDFRHATLQQLYACLLAIQCLRELVKEDNAEHDDADAADADNLQFFSHVFHKYLGATYGLPGRLRKLEEQGHVAAATDAAAGNGSLGVQQPIEVSNINLVHDFSLSKEIDDLIQELFGHADVA